MTAPLDTKRLKKLLLVALSSDQPGEIVAAVAKIKATLAKAGLDIHWLADSVLPVAPASMPSSWSIWAREPVPVVPWQDMLAQCSDRKWQLKRGVERAFIESLMDQWASRNHWQPTERQLNWLTKIYRTEVRQ